MVYYSMVRDHMVYLVWHVITWYMTISYIIVWYVIIRYIIVWYVVIWYIIVWYVITWCIIVWCMIVWYGVVWYEHTDPKFWFQGLRRGDSKTTACMILMCTCPFGSLQGVLGRTLLLGLEVCQEYLHSSLNYVLRFGDFFRGRLGKISFFLRGQKSGKVLNPVSTSRAQTDRAPKHFELSHVSDCRILLWL